ncbi:response regulator [Azorhizobium oxalatiphilum]|uniref:Response regulator n=1 Tax=Azorhizobium oxalatiphilum TaxID=980631 RepID=A0A917FC14_9HYPH|nr:response regulator [Azorhizobium oxalatiphilum]GGF60833.1 response regulator [Azorhizobium oxalatiphilum]
MGRSAKRILIVEDEFLVALGLQDNLEALGYDVVGPAGTLGDAMRLAERAQMDAAILDVNLHGDVVFSAADILADRGIPLIFCSGHVAPQSFPERFHGALSVPKPYTIVGIDAALREVFETDDDDDSGPDRHSGSDHSMSF